MAKETVEEYKHRVASAGGKAIRDQRGIGYFKKLRKKGIAKQHKKEKKESRLKKLLFD